MEQPITLKNVMNVWAREYADKHKDITISFPYYDKLHDDPHCPDSAYSHIFIEHSKIQQKFQISIYSTTIDVFYSYHHDNSLVTMAFENDMLIHDPQFINKLEQHIDDWVKLGTEGK